MLVIRTQDELERASRELGRGSGLGGVLVPTMGALHAGHAALIRRGAELAGDGPCIVSIFVNPTQFNQRSDYDRYPRTLEADLAVCEGSGASVVFAPVPEVVYPLGGVIVVPALPVVATTPGLEDRFRPGHFAGVCQVVMRLFRLLEPAAAVFGEKDWQQLQVVTAMAREATMDIRIVPHPTLRDPDGLAMSSRNRFLSPSEREAALAIPRSLSRAAEESGVHAAEACMAEAIVAAGLRLEYAVVRDAESLGALAGASPARSLIAAWAGGTRLIDNRAWPIPPGSPLQTR